MDCLLPFCGGKLIPMMSSLESKCDKCGVVVGAPPA